MNPFFTLSVAVGLTVLACVLITNYMRPFLKRILVDLCQTEERAQFWTAFSNVLLIGFPMLIALGFRPESTGVEAAIFEILGRVSGSLAGYLFTLVGIGLVVSFFALVAPRTVREAK